MEPSSFYSLPIFLFLLLAIDQPINCQQDYVNNTQLNCDQNPSISRGYLCNGQQMECQSFLTFRSRPPYDSPTGISSLLDSEASSIASFNNISSTSDKIPLDRLIKAPVSCSCTGSIYQHNARYIVQALDTYFGIANDTYQGLTTCQAIVGQNYYTAENITIGVDLVIPLRCACPTPNQIASGVISLMVYIVTWGDSIESIANAFGVDKASILYANNLSEESEIFPFTPLLIPLNEEGCVLNLGGYNCKPNSNKSPVKLVVLLGAGIGVGLLGFFLLVYKLHKFLKKRRHRIRKQMLFEQNGGLLLQQRLHYHGSGERTKLFTEEELQGATDNYSQSRLLGQGGYGTVYKGMLPDGSIVAVKRSKAIDRSQIDQFINEVVILSQINHRNIVRLLGCCLETDFPLLVYEFVSNGTLSNHIHEKDQESSLPWEHRLRIASEVAGAVAYMHSAASFPIFHRDIKSSNILLDDRYSAKVSDFGTSRSIPFERTHLTTAVQGTFGYLDPVYFHTSQFTDKSDVYSFGVVLIELLTGEKPISLSRDEDERNLVAHFISLMNEDRLFQILDSRVAREARREDIHAIANLAMRCLRHHAKKRPTMREVAMELDGLRKLDTCLQIDDLSFVHASGEAEQECMDDAISSNFEMETTSI